MKPIQRKNIWLVIPCLSCFLFAVSCSPGGSKSPPLAHDGVIDLSGWNFKKDGPLELSGEWKFKWKESSPEFAKTDFADSSWDTYSVPDFWNNTTAVAEGFAWFRLKVRHSGLPAENLGIYLKSMQSAGRLFIDGREVMHDGIPGTSRETTVACTLPQAVPISVDTGREFIIAWNIANYHNRNGGPRFSPVIGLHKDLSFSLWLQDLRYVFATGFIIMMGLYSFILWFLRKQEKANLIFSFICLVVALRIIFIGAFIQRFAPAADLFDMRMRLESVITFATVLLFMNFLHHLFPRRIYYQYIRVCNWFTVTLCGCILILPCWITSRFTLFFNIIFILFFIWMVSSIIRAVRDQSTGSKIILVGIMIIGLTLLNDILYTSVPYFPTANLFWLGMMVVIACYAGLLSFRFAQAHKTSEELSRNLQKEVDRQTTKIMEQNQKLENLIKEKTDSFINFNHEIKTPLTLMGNYLEKALGKHTADQDLHILKQNLDKLKRDVTNSLDLEKLIRNQAFYMHDQTVSLSTIVKEKVALFGVMSEYKGIDLSFSDMPELFINIDPFALDRIINNLLDNAIRYTEKGGKVTVSLKRGNKNGKKIECSVADTGIGIPQEHLENIFEPYYQMRRQKSNLQGMGMGLNIVKRIMDELGGEIKVESREQKGTRFILTFTPASPPVEKAGVLIVPTLSQPLVPVEIHLAPETYEEGKETLLIVEDNKSMLAYLQSGLADAYNVFYARSGREAVHKLESIPPPDLIVSDIMMDEMDGYEFLDTLIRSEEYRSIPLVFLTARTLPQDTLAGLSKGAVDVIHKPFSLDELKAKIGSLVRQQKAAREAVISEMREKLERLPLNGYSRPELDLLREENYRRFRMTPREREIIPLLVQGFPYKEISERLSISLNTLKPYICDIYKKCGVNNKVGLIGIFKID